MIFSRDSVEFGPRARLSRGLLFSLFTLSCALATAACQLVTNDFRDRPLPGYAHVYKPGLRPGSSARELLDSRRFRKVVVEVQFLKGMNPTQEALNHFLTFLERVLGRDASKLELVLDDPIPSPRKDVYSILDVREIESRYRRVFPKKDTLAVYVLFLDGASSDDRGTRKLLGQAHQNTSIVLYENTIRGLADANSVWIAEATVLEHEFGHLLGLTGLAPTAAQSPHEDPEHRGHCANPTCLMYHASESSEILPLLGGRVPELDAECLRDLETLTAVRS